MLQVLEKTGLSDGREGGALLLLQPDLLESHHLVGEVTEPSEHRGVAALSQLLQLDVGLQLPVRGVAPEGRVALGSGLLCPVEKYFRLGTGRPGGPQDDTGHHLLLDLLVQQPRV